MPATRRIPQSRRRWVGSKDLGCTQQQPRRLRLLAKDSEASQRATSAFRERLACGRGFVGSPHLPLLSRWRFHALPLQYPQSPHASAHSASEGRCPPVNRTPVANVALKQPAATANHGRQRDEEIKSKLRLPLLFESPNPTHYANSQKRPQTKRSFNETRSAR